MRRVRAAVALAAAGFATPLLARVGGGGGYSGGGGDGDGGDAGLVFALIRFLLWLVFRHPLIGIPVVIVVAVIVMRMARSGRLRWTAREETRVFRAPDLPTVPARPGPVNFTPVRASDALFSEPVFVEFAQLVYARAHAMRGAGRREPLEPWMAPEAIDALFADRAGLESVAGVIVGATRVEQAATEGGFVVVHVGFEANLTETRTGAARQVLCRERWTFRRKAGVPSPPPARMRALTCPGCGSPLEPKTDGTCPSCGTTRRGGLAMWEVARIPSSVRRELAPSDVPQGGGVESGTARSTVFDPRLQAAKRAFTGAHPEHAWAAFEALVRERFVLLQAAWSSQEWERARLLETDTLYQTHRFWMERYRAFGLRNRVEDVAVTQVVVVKIETDAFFEAVTVRLFARARDWTERADGTVTSGSKTATTTFSEYWTFLRAVGPVAARSESCPACAAPIDAAGPALVCAHCGAKLELPTSEWLASRIEQDDAY